MPRSVRMLESSAMSIFAGVLVTESWYHPRRMRSGRNSSTLTSYVSPSASRTVVKRRLFAISVPIDSAHATYSGCDLRTARAAAPGPMAVDRSGSEMSSSACSRGSSSVGIRAGSPLSLGPANDEVIATVGFTATFSRSSALDSCVTSCAHRPGQAPTTTAHARSSLSRRNRRRRLRPSPRGRGGDSRIGASASLTFASTPGSPAAGKPTVPRWLSSSSSSSAGLKSPTMLTSMFSGRICASIVFRHSSSTSASIDAGVALTKRGSSCTSSRRMPSAVAFSRLFETLR
mmetsp:Transcript_15323/g.38749  ORF Transcript_15323/g.38749 Transcript_15323/m.38749 type:complete len:288 (-) Transcript_15323:2295-3158(-)